LFIYLLSIRQNDEPWISTDFDSDLSSTKAAFDIFLDELFEIPYKVKASRTKKQPLPFGELSTNHQHNTKVSLVGNTKAQQGFKSLPNTDSRF
jgi:hypothetical protein